MKDRVRGIWGLHGTKQNFILIKNESFIVENEFDENDRNYNKNDCDFLVYYIFQSQFYVQGI